MDLNQQQDDLARQAQQRRLYLAVLNYRAAMHIYVKLFTRAQWLVVCNAYQAVVELSQ